MNYIYGFDSPSIKYDGELSDEFLLAILDLVYEDDIFIKYSVCWCLAWCGERRIIPNFYKNELIPQLVRIWTQANENHMQKMVSWALTHILHPSFPKGNLSTISNLKDIVHKTFTTSTKKDDKIVSIYLSVIMSYPMDASFYEFFKSMINTNLLGDPDDNVLQFARIMSIDLNTI